MKRNLVWGVMCLGLVTAGVGCSHSGIVRGQNPGMAYNSGMEMSGSMQVPAQKASLGPMYYDGPTTGYNECPMPCPPQADVWRPTHHHTYEYHAPKNLVYPPANQQPGVVQYPYYTVKGPTDFFYTGN